MKVSRLLLIVSVIILFAMTAGCTLVGKNPLSAVGSLVPQATPEDTLEATVDTAEATAENTPLVRPKTAAATVKPKATAIKKATASVTPKTPGNAGSSLPIGAPLYSDDFTDPSSGWAEDVSDQSEMGYQNGKYIITVHDTDSLAWSSANQLYSDFVIEIAASKVSGPGDGEYGIIFRYVDGSNYYIFKVDTVGSYKVSALINDEWVGLTDWTESTALKRVAGTNKLALVAQGDTLIFYINGVRVDEVSDGAFTEGDIALVAGTHDVGELVARFSSVNVWEVGDIASPIMEESGSIDKGEMLYSETFDDESTGWDVWEDDISRGGYISDTYFIEVLAYNRMTWGNGYQYFDDFVVEVDASKVAGPDDNAFGIVLRYVDRANYYIFKASSDGQYAFGYYMDNSWTEVVPWTQTDTVNQGESTNRLGVACKGNHFILSINDTVVEDITDDTFSLGDIGLMASSRSDAGVLVTFDDLIVWEAN